MYSAVSNVIHYCTCKVNLKYKSAKTNNNKQNKVRKKRTHSEAVGLISYRNALVLLLLNKQFSKICTCVMMSKARTLKAYDCLSSWNIFNHLNDRGAMAKSLMYKCTYQRRI